MSDILRINRATIRKNQITYNKSGFMVVPIIFMRTGILLYRDLETGKIIKEYVSPEELFKPESVATANGMLFMEDHPEDMLYPDNWKDHATGVIHSVKEVEVPGSQNRHLGGLLTVHDGNTIRSIESSNKEEVSAGYWVTTVDAPGITPEGESYDSLQTNIEYNHTGWVWFGRAGEDVKIKKNIRKNNSDIKIYYQIPEDSRKNSEDNNKKGENFKIMIFKRKNGTSRDVQLKDADELFVNEVIQEKESEVTTAKNEAEQANTKLKALEAELDITKKEIEKLNSRDFKKEYEDRKNLEDFARTVLGDDYQFDGKSDVEIKRNCIETAYPDLAEKCKDDNYVNPAFDLHKNSIAKNAQEEQGRYNAADQNFHQQSKPIFSHAAKQNSLTGNEKLITSVFAEMKR